MQNLLCHLQVSMDILFAAFDLGFAMVQKNMIHRNSFSCETRARRPRKFLFNIGDYDVSFHKQRYATKKHRYFHCAVWYRKQVIGSVDLSTIYYDATSVVSVDTQIANMYQGLGIAYRVYEGLVCEHNVTLHTNNQSPLAIKLWRKFAANNLLRMYFIYNDTEGLFTSDIFDVSLNKDGVLEVTDYDGKKFDPYNGRGRTGSLLLLKKKSSLDTAIQKYVPLRRAQQRIIAGFTRYDEWKNV
jgi:hypothetical protein